MRLWECVCLVEALEAFVFGVLVNFFTSEGTAAIAIFF
jgi:hypothetical protein